MTEEDKELLLKDLCARLRYGVKCYPVITNGEPNIIGGYCEIFDDFYIREVGGWFNISMIKPYLRSMSSMTDKERKEFINLCSTHYTISSGMDQTYLTIDVGNGFHKQDAKPYNKIEDIKIIDWLNKHHFDYRGLIEKGLALEAPEGMYKTE